MFTLFFFFYAFLNVMCEKFGIMNIIDEEWEENDVQEYYSCKTLCTYINKLWITRILQV